jgi:hypothetical protein
MVVGGSNAAVATHDKRPLTTPDRVVLSHANERSHSHQYGEGRSEGDSAHAHHVEVLYLPYGRHPELAPIIALALSSNNLKNRKLRQV